MSAEDEELLPEERVFCHEFGLPSGEVSHSSHYERGASRFRPVDEVVLERLKAHAYQSLDEGKNSMHRIRFPFVKMS